MAKNTNCLDGLRCPNPCCKSLEPFEIEATTTVKMYDAGSESTSGFEWDDDSTCTCVECGHSTKIKDFKI